MIFGTYKLHKATSGMMTILSEWKRKTLRASRLNSAPGR